jgi:NTE family protein
MSLEEEPANATLEIRLAIDCLRACAALADIDAESLERLAAAAVQFSLPAGITLFESGTTSDGIYLVIAGRIGVKIAGTPGWTAQLRSGELLGELSWLMNAPHSAQLVATRDSELLWLSKALLDDIAARSPRFALAIARLCAQRLYRSTRGSDSAPRARVFTIVPNSPDVDAVSFAASLVTELNRIGRAEFVWDVRASSHTVGWFNHIEESNDYVVYLADASSSGWTRQCVRQADLLLLAANVRDTPRPWAEALLTITAKTASPVELVLLHGEQFAYGHTTRWLESTSASAHHHIVDPADLARLTRLITHRGVGLVLSGGGARGFAHLGVIQALREAQVPIDFVGGASIGAIIAAGASLGWDDAQMRLRYRRSFVDTNPVNDYTFPFIALTRGGKVTRLLRREFGDVLIEDTRLPYFCVSANLTTGRAVEHRRGPLWQALRASVAIPGVMPPVLSGDAVLVDGAAINNLPVDIMKVHAPGVVIACDVGADRPFTADYDAAEQPPFWRMLSRSGSGKRRINIFQILMRAGMVGGEAGALAQRELADLLLKPPLDDIDLLNWQAFDRAIGIGYEYTAQVLRALPDLPRHAPAARAAARGPSSLMEEIERRERSVAAVARAPFPQREAE